MVVRDELYRQLNFSSKEIISFMQQIIINKKQEIDMIKSKIAKYEEKKRKEETFYQSLSPVRKFFASRSPSHHQAVEYIVHVKERQKQIDNINQSIHELSLAIERCKDGAFEEDIVLSSLIIEEIMKHKKMED